MQEVYEDPSYSRTNSQIVLYGTHDIKLGTTIPGIYYSIYTGEFPHFIQYVIFLGRFSIEYKFDSYLTLNTINLGPMQFLALQIGILESGGYLDSMGKPRN